MAAAAILDLQVMRIWLFRRVDSVAFVFCTKLGQNIRNGSDFWSRGHLRMAVMHLPGKFGADIFIQSGVIDIFPKSKMGAAALLDFQIM